MKVLFLLTDGKKLLYENGEIRKVKNIDIENTEVRLARKMIRICPCLPPHIFTSRYRDVMLSEKYKTSMLTERLYMHNFIVFVDHWKKRVELLIDDGEVVELFYEKLEFLRKYFYVVMGGEYLESVSAEEVELNSK